MHLGNDPYGNSNSSGDDMREPNPPMRGATTDEVLMQYQYETNPVTKAVFRQIIGNRVDLGRSSHLSKCKKGSY